MIHRAPLQLLGQVALLATIPCAVLAQTQYTLLDLGVLPGAGASRANAISPNGSYVVGGTDVNEGFVRRSGLPMEDLGDMSGFPGEFGATGVNDTGLVCGVSYLPSPSRARAFTWRTSEGFTDLGTLGGSSSYANAVNATGTVAGRGFVAATDNGHAFLRPAGSLIDIHSSGNYSDATDVNDQGQACGARFDSSFSDARGFRWSEATGQVLLPLLAGGTNSYTAKMNNSGVIVGVSSSATSSSRPVRWPNTSTVQDLGTLGGADGGATGINSSGVIVGWAHNAAQEERPFIWSATTGMRDLTTLVLPGSGLTLLSVNDISDNGLIVGQGRNADGDLRAVQLEPIAVPPTRTGQWRWRQLQPEGPAPQPGQQFAMAYDADRGIYWVTGGGTLGEIGKISYGTAQGNYRWSTTPAPVAVNFPIVNGVAHVLNRAAPLPDLLIVGPHGGGNSGDPSGVNASSYSPGWVAEIAGDTPAEATLRNGRPLTAPNGNIGRTSSHSAFDPSTNLLWIFGGDSNYGGASVDNIYSVGVLGNPVAAPSNVTSIERRISLMGAFDPARRVGYYFGGRRGPSGGITEAENRTYRFDAANPGVPTEFPTTGAPAHRLSTPGGGAFINPGTGNLIVVGGYNSAEGFGTNEVWELNTTTSTWSQITPSGTPPAPVWNYAGALDASNGVYLLFGGGSTESQGQVWLLDLPTGSTPTPTLTATITVTPTQVPDPEKIVLVAGGGLNPVNVIQRQTRALSRLVYRAAKNRGFTDDRIQFLSSLEPVGNGVDGGATLTAVDQAISVWGKGTSRLWVVLLDHGVRTNTNPPSASFILDWPVGGQPTYLEARTLDRFLDNAQTSPGAVPQVVLLMDFCFSGQFLRDCAWSNGGPNLGTSRLVVSSTLPDRLAVFDQGDSDVDRLSFTSHFFSGLYLRQSLTAAFNRANSAVRAYDLPAAAPQAPMIDTDGDGFVTAADGVTGADLLFGVGNPTGDVPPSLSDASISFAKDGNSIQARVRSADSERVDLHVYTNQIYQSDPVQAGVKVNMAKNEDQFTATVDTSNLYPGQTYVVLQGSKVASDGSEITILSEPVRQPGPVIVPTALVTLVEFLLRLTATPPTDPNGDGVRDAADLQAAVLEP